MPESSSDLVRLASPGGRWLLLATVLGSGMALLDATVVNVALERIGADFGAGFAGLQWTLNGYTLTLASFILLGGSLGDRSAGAGYSCSARSGSPWPPCCAGWHPTSRC